MRSRVAWTVAGPERGRNDHAVPSEASWEQDPDTRAELVYVGNAMLGLHEQTRVDPDVFEALTLPEAQRLWERAAPVRAALASITAGARSSVALRGVHALLRRAANLGTVSTLGTLFFMELRLGDEVFALSEDVTPTEGREFPEHLRVFDTDRPHVRSRQQTAALFGNPLHVQLPPPGACACSTARAA